MTELAFHKIQNKSVAPIESDLAGWKKIQGSPSMKTWIEYSSDDGVMISGWWEATPGIYHATYESWEFVHLIEGLGTITPDGGSPCEVGPGDAFVIEKSFRGTWEIHQKVLKHFSIKLK